MARHSDEATCNTLGEGCRQCISFEQRYTPRSIRSFIRHSSALFFDDPHLADHYRTCLARANRALASGVFPKATLDLIEQDIVTTLPAIHIFHKETGPLYGELKEMLVAWVVSRSDEGMGYTFGAAKVAAMFLINMPAQQGFNVMRNLLERHLMRSFFGGERTRDDASIPFHV